MKKMLALLLSLMMLMSGMSLAVAEDVPFVGLAFGAMDATPAALAAALTAKMDALGWKYVITNADQDSSKLLADVENLCQQQPDVIFVRLINDLVAPGIVDICNNYDIPCGFMSNADHFDELEYMFDSGDPESVRGYPLADWLNAYCEANPGFVPKVGVVVGDFSAEICFGRTDNLKEVCTTAEWVVETEADPKWTATGGMRVMEDWLQKYSLDELNTILVWSDEMCIGVIQALQAAGKNPDDYVVMSYDGLELVYDYIREGWLDASSGLNMDKLASGMIDIAQRVVAGDPFENPVNFAYSVYVLDNTSIDNVVNGETDKINFFDYSSYFE